MRAAHEAFDALAHECLDFAWTLHKERFFVDAARLAHCWTRVEIFAGYF